MAAAHGISSALSSRQPVDAGDVGLALISAKTRACLVSFENCVRISTDLDLQRQSSLEDQSARFSIWASGMGVFAEPKVSLDHRLRGVPDVRNMVAGLLDVLYGLIEQRAQPSSLVLSCPLAPMRSDTL